MEARDRLEIQELLSRYGYVVDDGAWAGFAGVFTEDGVCDLTAWQVPLMRGLAAIRETYARLEHPVAHLTLNTIITATSADTAEVRSKMIAVRPDRRVETAEYHDAVQRTPDGWRIARRTAVARMSDGSWDAFAGEVPESEGPGR